MHKEMVIVILIVILIIVGNVLTQNYTKESVKIMQESLGEIREDLENNNESGIVEEKVSELNKKWENRSNNLTYYLEHDELEKQNPN